MTFGKFYSNNVFKVKKYLPTSNTLSTGKKGFTLIELMVVITILAILAVVGFVAFSSVSARGRDAKRMAEIDAIQKALEKNYQPGVGYQLLANADFQNGEVPIDPLSGQAKCSAYGTTTIYKTCEYCVVTTAGDFPGCLKVSTTKPPAGSSYIICANLETKAGANGATYYCKSNAQ